MKGGYQIIDLGGVTLSGTSITISGLQNKIKNANGKPILITNFKISSVLYKDMYYANYVYNSTNIILSMILGNVLGVVTVSNVDGAVLTTGTISVS